MNDESERSSGLTIIDGHSHIASTHFTPMCFLEGVADNIEVRLRPADALIVLLRLQRSQLAPSCCLILAVASKLKLLQLSTPLTVDLTKTNTAKTWVSAHWPTPGGK